MESIDFRSLSERLRTELSRVYFWQKIVRILSIIVYLFVFCWMMFVLFGGYLVGYIGLENYSVVTQYIFPVFMGFIVLNFAFSRSLMKFQGQENDIMRSIIGAAYGLQLQFHIFNAPLQSGELLACLQFRVIFYG